LKTKRREEFTRTKREENKDRKIEKWGDIGDNIERGKE
jgi:hypothetical protein